MNKILNPNLQKVIRVLKDDPDNALSSITNKQLSDISGVSTKYLQRNKELIEAYYNNSTPSSEEDYTFVYDRSIVAYIELAKQSDSKFIYRKVLGAIVGYVLKWEHKQLSHIQKNTKAIEVGKAVMELMCLIYSRKDTTQGTPIHSQSKAVKTLFRGNKIAFIDKLFKRSDGYYAGNTAKKWKLTPLSIDILHQSIDIFFTMFFDICLTNCSTYSSICNQHERTLHTTVLSVSVVKDLSISSILHILHLTIGFDSTHNGLIVSLEHTSSTDEALGRAYNLFCRIRGIERTQLGFINYDISSALQTICLQLIGATKEDCPILMSYATDKGSKTTLRNTIANDLGIAVSDVKAKLTAFANGGVSGIDKHPMYREFQEESDRLRRAVLSHTAKHNSWLLEKAIAQSKRQLPEDIDWYSLDKEDNQTMTRNKSSVFFFVWTYYERLIRKAMLQCLPDGIEVHDAVYSKTVVDTKDIEQMIFDKTNFRVIIERSN